MWTTARLAEVASIRHGGTPSKKEPRYWNGDIPWVSPKDMRTTVLTDTADHVTADAVTHSATSIMPANSVFLVARSGVLVHSVPVALARRPMAFNQDIKAIAVDPTRLEPDYAVWFLRSQEDRILVQGVKRGATVHSLHSGFIENLLIPLPPLEEQRRVVDILNRANGIRRLRRDAVDKTRQLIPALFVNVFGDPATNPKHWPMCQVRDLCTKITDGTHQPPGFVSQGIPFIFINNIVGGWVDLRTSKFITEETYQELTRRTSIEIGDTLYSTVGSYGVAVSVDTTERFCFQRHIAILKPDRAKVLAPFLTALMNTPFVRGQADIAARGVAQKTVNLGDIRKFSAIQPPVPVQQAFVERESDIRATITQQERMAEVSDQLVAALMARLFDGG